MRLTGFNFGAPYFKPAKFANPYPHRGVYFASLSCLARVSYGFEYQNTTLLNVPIIQNRSGDFGTYTVSPSEGSPYLIVQTVGRWVETKVDYLGNVTRKVLIEIVGTSTANVVTSKGYGFANGNYELGAGCIAGSWSGVPAYSPSYTSTYGSPFVVSSGTSHPWPFPSDQTITPVSIPAPDTAWVPAQVALARSHGMEGNIVSATDSALIYLGPAVYTGGEIGGYNTLSPTRWSGGGYVEYSHQPSMVNNVMPPREFGRVDSFTVPDDCIAPKPEAYRDPVAGYSMAWKYTNALHGTGSEIVMQSDKNPPHEGDQLSFVISNDPYTPLISFTSDGTLEQYRAAYFTAWDQYAVASGYPFISQSVRAWVSAYDDFILRKKKWLKKNSDDTIRGLRQGILPLWWENYFKRGVGYGGSNNHAARLVPLKTTLVETVLSDTTRGGLDNDLQTGTKVVQRVATYKYTLLDKTQKEMEAIRDNLPHALTMKTTMWTAGRFDVELSQVVTGLMVIDQTMHNDTYGNINIYSSRRIHYADWPVAANKNNLTDDQKRDALGLGGDTLDSVSKRRVIADYEIWHFTLQPGVTAPNIIPTLRIRNGVLQEGKVPNSLYAFASPLGYTTDGKWSDYVNLSTAIPAYPNENVGFTEDIPDIIAQYRQDVPVVSTNTTTEPDIRAYTDSSLVDGEIIAALVYGPVKGGESLGMFSDIATNAFTQMELFGTATFQYKFDTGTFLFLGWKDAVPHYQVMSASVKKAGSGGKGTSTVRGTTGVGTKFEAQVRMLEAGGIDSVLGITIKGDYTTEPTDVRDEPVIAVTGDALTGASLNISIRAMSFEDMAFDPTWGFYLGGKTINQVPNPLDQNADDVGSNAFIRYFGVKWSDVLAFGRKILDPTTVYQQAYDQAIAGMAASLARTLAAAIAAHDDTLAANIRALQANAASQVFIAQQIATQTSQQTLAGGATAFEIAVLPYVKPSFPCIAFEAAGAATTQDASVVH
jgi:hypothetical protein